MIGSSGLRGRRLPPPAWQTEYEAHIWTAQDPTAPEGEDKHKLLLRCGGAIRQ